MTIPRKDSYPASRTVARPVANLGNTCYMNAVLQALAHAPELCLAMDCEAHRSSCPIASENKEKSRRSNSPDGSATSNESETRRPTATRKSRRSGRKSPPEQREDSPNTIKFCALCELEEHILSVHDYTYKDKPVAPSSFVNGFIEQVAPWFRLGVQEDSHEFLRLLIDAMQKSCERARSDPNQNTPQGNDPDQVPSIRKVEDDKDTEYPFSLFRGTVESTVTCGSCGAASSTLDPIEDIGLEVTAPTASSSGRSGTERTSRNISPLPAPTLYDVETAFQRYSRAEALDSGYKCEKCGKVGKATKQSRLASIPPILTLHLKRFRYGSGGLNGAGDVGSRRSRSELGQLLGGSEFFGGKSGSAKIEGHIKFNILFDLQPFLTQELQDKHANMLCRLFAVIVHAGKNSHSGHYIAYVRNLAKNEWWKMDDGRVTNVTVSEVQNAEAYMLFYRVVQHPVATKLEQDYQIKMGRNPQDGAGIVKETSGVSSPSYELKSLRKRPHPVSAANGELWFRTKTSMPPYLMGVIRKIEERIADDLVLREEFVQFVRDRVGEDVASITAKLELQDGGDTAVLADYRQKIIRSIAQAAQWIERVKGISPSQLLTPQVATSLENLADDKLVAVVEPEEEMDLL
ncbi:hypothetical protein ACA910_004859 [Epithemia clementina (nom. ined.)]